MSYRTILVHAGDERRLSRLLGSALVLARQNDAHVTALSVLPPVIIDPALTPGGVATVIDSHRRAYEQQRTRMQASFNEAIRLAGIIGEWVNADSNHGGVWSKVVDYGRSADLIVASQANPDWPFSKLVEAPAEIVLHSGRPVLLIPNSGQHAELGKRVLIAWNGRREAARAAFDALPILKRAEIVRVLWVNPEQEQELGQDLPAADLCTALARHGVTCEATETTHPKFNAGETLLARVHDTATDLLVMGCYGHSRFREFIFGGATRHLLNHMNVPVLMAH